MAIEFDSVEYSAPGFVNTTTYAHTVSDLLSSPCMFVHTNAVIGGTNVIVCTYGGDAFTQLGTQNFIDGGNRQVQEVWYLAGPSTGLNNVVVTWSGAGELTVTSIVWDGVDRDNPIRVPVLSAQNSGVGNTLNVVLASQVGDLCVDFLSVKNVNGPDGVPAAGQTLRSSLQSNEVANTNRHRDNSSDELGATAVTMSWTFTNLRAAGLIGVPLRAAAADRGRATKYFFPFWDANPKLFDANGKIVDPSDILVDEWVEAEGLALPTAENPDSFIEDPSRSKIIEVSATQSSARIKTNKNQFAETLVSRVAAGS